MMRALRFWPRKFGGDEHGQVLPMVAVTMVILLGMVAVVVDVGRVLWAQRALQAATDAAALAGAAWLPSASAVSVATHYSAAAGGLNARANLPNVTMVSGYPLVKCLATLTAQGQACISPANANAIQVQEQAVVQLYFAGMFGHPTMTISAIATAAAKGGSPTPYNVALIVDTTLSMNNFDSDCGATQIACALNGVQVLLQSLSPCAKSLSACTFTAGQAADSVDRVSLFTFPNVTTSTAAIDSSCTSGTPAPAPGQGYQVSNGDSTAASYTFPNASAASYSSDSAITALPKNGRAQATYQITGFLSDYKTSYNAPSLNTSSTLVQAAGGVSGCGGMAPSNYDGAYGTYYAGALYAAQAALLAEQGSNPGSQNAIILLSDGDATAQQSWNGYTSMNPSATGNGQYPSWVGECGQAVVAAQAIAAAGTQMYSVAYGSEPSGCKSDVNAGSYPNISPCDTMGAIASAPQYFYSDWKQSGSGSTCVSSQPVTALSDIFKAIAAGLSTSRLIPNNTT
jgi:Flp pilus assembly protein TadG